jgi:hypothetical protein
MAEYFPRRTVVWRLEETPFMRRLSLSLVLMAAVTGVLVKLFIWLASTYLPLTLILISYAIAFIFLLTMATVHWSAYPVRHWLWRAPLFGLAEGMAEALTSLVLILMGRELNGSARAHLSDWPSIAVELLLYRTLLVILFAVTLGAVVQFVRFAMLRREKRDSTAVAIHAERVRQSQETDVAP